MAGPTFGITGEVTSWTGGSAGLTESLLTYNDGARFSLNIGADTPDATAFISTTGVKFSNPINGLRNWSGEIAFQLGTAQIGAKGLVTFASGYTANLNAFNLEFVASQADVTEYVGSAGVTWRQFIPGLISWSGGYSGFYDDTTAAVNPGVAAAAATFGIVDGAGGKSVGGSIIVSNVGLGVEPSNVNTISHTFVGAGQPTISGTSTDVFLPVDAGGGVYTLTTPQTGKTLTLQASTGQTFSGEAFWNRISVQQQIDQPILVTVGFQGTGALTIG